MLELLPARVHRILLLNLQAAIADIAQVAIGGSVESEAACGFATSYEYFREASDLTRRSILSDPRAIVWIDRVQMGLAEGGLNVLATAEWNRMLSGFGTFALAAATLEGKSFTARV